MLKFLQSLFTQRDKNIQHNIISTTDKEIKVYKENSENNILTISSLNSVIQIETRDECFFIRKKDIQYFYLYEFHPRKYFLKITLMSGHLSYIIKPMNTESVYSKICEINHSITTYKDFRFSFLLDDVE